MPVEILAILVALTTAVITTGANLLIGHFLAGRRQRIAHEQELIKMSVERFHTWVHDAYLPLASALGTFVGQLSQFSESPDDPPPDQLFEETFWAMARYLVQRNEHFNRWGGGTFLADLTPEEILQALDVMILAGIAEVGLSRVELHETIYKSSAHELLPAFKPKLSSGGCLENIFVKFKASMSKDKAKAITRCGLPFMIVLNDEMNRGYAPWYGRHNSSLTEEHLALAGAVFHSIAEEGMVPEQKLDAYLATMKSRIRGKAKAWKAYLRWERREGRWVLVIGAGGS